MTVAFNSSVDVTVEAAFGYAPYNTSPVWTDITTDVRFLQIGRGRSHTLDTIGAGSCRLRLDNTAGDYDPTNTAGANYPNVLPMVPIRVQAEHSATTYDLFYGFVTSWPMSWTIQKDAVVDVVASDGIMLLNLTNSGSAQVQENTGTRIGNLLDDTSWPASWRSIATGDVTAAAFTPDCGVVWSLIQQVVDTEGGLAFIDGAGDLVFQNRDYRTGLSSTITFGDDGSELRYEDVEMTYDDAQIWNRVEVSRSDPDAATVGADNTASITAYGRRLLSINDTLHVSDATALTHAQNMLARWKDPKIHVTNLAMNASRTNSWANVLGLEVSQKITVNRRPAYAGNTISIDGYVESLIHSIRPEAREWRTVLTTTQYD